jgi:hypothetical protein
MPARLADWKAKEGLAVGKGATMQAFVSKDGDHNLQIEVTPWGEGRLTADGVEIAQVGNATGRREAFRHLATAAERFLRGELNNSESRKFPSTSPTVKTTLSTDRED